MGHIKYQRRISLLRKENRKLKMQIRFLTKRKNYLNDIIHKYLPDFKLDDEIDENNSKKTG